ncbi:type II toxin-antitoxin system VapC family toxin [Tistrella sp. BH-R2-4]|uniref:Ribonuclease VapC n=1 Tax=Tistrella arctica TaxID=3133430 RepID=A0ABU9YGL0_9PROT
MIVVDTSALMAIILDEPEADACIAVLISENNLLMSAATLAEALIVASRRNVGDDMVRLIDGLNVDVVSVTPATARRVADVYDIWGKGIHPAALNFADCFAYDLAKQCGCPLLFVGNDFGRTDIQRAGGRIGPESARSLR